MAEKESKTVLERTYTVPLRAAFRNAPSYRKANRAVKELRAFLARHMKSEDVRLGQHVNDFLWRHGIANPPPRVTVRAVKDEEDVVRAELEGKEYKESVRPIPKEEEPGTLKERLLGKKEDEGEEKPEKAKPAPEKPAKAEQPAPDKSAPAKPAEKPAQKDGKPAAKDAEKPKDTAPKQ